MQMIINMDRGNAAFQDNGKDYETARILKDVVRLVEDGYREGRLHDYNGNHVGYWEIHLGDEE